MPSFAWLAEWKVDQALAPRKMIALQKLGVPYKNLDIDGARDAYRKQADRSSPTSARRAWRSPGTARSSR